MHHSSLQQQKCYHVFTSSKWGGRVQWGELISKRARSDGAETKTCLLMSASTLLHRASPPEKKGGGHLQGGQQNPKHSDLLAKQTVPFLEERKLCLPSKTCDQLPAPPSNLPHFSKPLRTGQGNVFSLASFSPPASQPGMCMCVYMRAHACLCVCLCLCMWWVRSSGEGWEATRERHQWRGTVLFFFPHLFLLVGG